MKNFIFALVTSVLLPVMGYSQSTINQGNSKFYTVPVPDDLKASGATVKSKTVEKTIKQDKVVYTVEIKYNSSTKNEAVYSLGIISDNAEVNKKLAKMNSKTGKPGNLSHCYSGEKQSTPDWQALADCVVNYVQVFLN